MTWQSYSQSWISAESMLWPQVRGDVIPAGLSFNTTTRSYHRCTPWEGCGSKTLTIRRRKRTISYWTVFHLSACYGLIDETNNWLFLSRGKTNKKRTLMFDGNIACGSSSQQGLYNRWSLIWDLKESHYHERTSWKRYYRNEGWPPELFGRELTLAASARWYYPACLFWADRYWTVIQRTLFGRTFFKEITFWCMSTSNQTRDTWSKLEESLKLIY